MSYLFVAQCITITDAVPVTEPVETAEKYDRLPTWGDMCIVNSTMQGNLFVKALMIIEIISLQN